MPDKISCENRYWPTTFHCRFGLVTSMCTNIETSSSAIIVPIHCRGLGVLTMSLASSWRIGPPASGLVRSGCITTTFSRDGGRGRAIRARLRARASSSQVAQCGSGSLWVASIPLLTRPSTPHFFMIF